MRRIAVASARADMVLGRAVYDLRGRPVLREGVTLTEAALQQLAGSGIGEVLVEDPRVADVPVGMLFPPSLEAQAVHALRQLLASVSSGAPILPPLLFGVTHAIKLMTDRVASVVPVDPDVSGTSSLEGYDLIHPVRVAEIALLLGREMGLDPSSLGLAALLANIGYVGVNASVLQSSKRFSAVEREAVERHTKSASSMLSNSGLGSDAILAIEQHHERWDGSGYPTGACGDEISLQAQILAISDVYHALLCERPYRGAFSRDEAMQFIMAFSGELFSIELVRVLVERVPLYSTGLGVKLSTGQIGIVSDVNPGHIGRPIVRICATDGRPVKKPYDLDLSNRETARIVVSDILL